MLEKDNEKLKKIINKFDVLSAASQYSAGRLNEISGINVIVIPVLLDFNTYNEFPDQFFNLYSDGKINLLSIGRVIPHKNQFELIEIFKMLCDINSEKFRLILAGSNDFIGDRYYRKIINYANEQNLKDIIFTGSIDNAEKNFYLKNSHFFVSTTLHEGFYSPLVEAMVFELPIIAYGASVIPETLKNGGIIIQSGNKVEFVEKFLQLFNDKNLQKFIINNQREIIKKYYSSQVVLTKWFSILDGV